MTNDFKLVNCGCGGEAFHDTVRGWNPVREDALVVWHRVICKNCGTQTKVFYTEDEAITAWNRAMSGITEKSSTVERTAKVEDLEKRSETSLSWEGICKNCGSYTMHEMNYCFHCGYKLEW